MYSFFCFGLVSLVSNISTHLPPIFSTKEASVHRASAELISFPPPRCDCTCKLMLVNNQTHAQTQMSDSSQLPDDTGCRWDKLTSVLSELAALDSDSWKSYFPLCWSSSEEEVEEEEDEEEVAIFCRSRNLCGFYCLRPHMTTAESSARCAPPCRQRHADGYVALSVSGCLVQSHGSLSVIHH